MVDQVVDGTGQSRELRQLLFCLNVLRVDAEAVDFFQHFLAALLL